MLYYKQIAESKGHKGPHKNIILTGPPETGKTTIIGKLVELLESQLKDEVVWTGFISTEIRTGVVRQGFEIRPIGQAAERVQPWTLSHMNLTDTPATVSKYGVDVETFNQKIPEVFKFKDTGDKLPVVLIDEIGMMECYSDVFQKEVEKAFDNPDWLVVAVVGQRGHEFMDKIRHREDVHLIVLTAVSDAIRENIPQQLFDNLCWFLEEEDDESISEEEVTGKLKDTSIGKSGEKTEQAQDTSGQKGSSTTS